MRKNSKLIKFFFKLELNLTDDNFDLNVRRVRYWTQNMEFKKLGEVNDPQKYANFSINIKCDNLSNITL